jgi:hypothetical protein
MFLKENFTGKCPIYKTELSIKIEGEFLVAKFIAHDASLFSFGDKYNDDLYCGDVVELFIDVGVENHYYEIEVNPKNLHFLADITNDGNGFSGEKINKDFIQSTVEIDGKTWITNIKIPLEAINYNKDYGIKFNAFRIDTDGGERDKHLFSLSPTLCGTFHKKEAFIKL